MRFKPQYNGTASWPLILGLMVYQYAAATRVSHDIQLIKPNPSMKCLPHYS
jgi:hypothetical protein